MPAPFTHTVTVRYAECDMQGHVFNGHYLTWFDTAHTALLRQATGRSYTAMVQAGIDIVVAEAGVRYLAAAHFEDELAIGIGLQPPSTTSLTSHFTITRGEELITRGFLRHICVDAATLRKRPWPDDLRAAFGPYVVTDLTTEVSGPRVVGKQEH
jgi:acyl-CoA thioester hydrolase